MGFDVEVDAWYQDGWFLGHDKPIYPVGPLFLGTPGVWVHCKNYAALQHGLEDGLHCFYHTDEDYVLTSRGYIWSYPGQPGGERTICVLPELGQSPQGFAGICSDYMNDTADLVRSGRGAG